MPKYVVEFGKSPGEPDDSDRRDAPAFHRNHAPIWAVLSGFLNGKSGDVLELGSGTGQHVVEFARQSPAITWWPSDQPDNNLRSIAAWRAQAGLANVRAPTRIDLMDHAQPWTTPGLPEQFLAIFCANVIHIAPWPVALGLFALAGKRLSPDGRLFLYGPFKREGRHTAPSNADFDASLRARDSDWGVRDIADVTAAAGAQGLHLIDTIAMPANNMMLVFALCGKQVAAVAETS